ncbi:hypothetical protein [Burkholderia stagnalis]|uniref:hypothetical protein n=1 Tax=Burkholderia stagnalis TaxID=1503054 RepID=UPI000F5AF022|nr:hypothetical protein [Burkholderia stagnalis]
MTEGAEYNLAIQRNIISGKKTYRTLRADLRRGCVLPPIVLALDREILTDEIKNNLAINKSGANEVRKNILDTLEQCEVYIVDGLQRTNALRSVAEEIEAEDAEQLQDFLETKIRLEIWVDISFGAIAYRMLLLNAGQKPMSIKHQVEILSLKLRDDLSSIEGIDIFTSKDKRRRRQPGQFHLSILAQSFQAWIQRQANIDMTNAVMEELLAESAIETLGSALSSRGSDDGFKDIIKWIVDIDCKLGVGNLDFFGNDTVMLGLCAVVGEFGADDDLRGDMLRALEKLSTQVDAHGAEALGVALFDRLRRGIDSKKFNVGAATREMVSKAFEQYFFSAGKKPMERCWQLASK